MRRNKPELFAVYNRFVKHGWYTGFHNDVAQQLSIDPRTVRARLEKALDWVRTQVEREGLS